MPELLSYIQVAVDENPASGQFILTGSHNLLLMERISQTLAGRTAVLHLHPFSLSELTGRQALVQDGRPFAHDVDSPPYLELWDLLWMGLFPRIHDRGLDPGRWLADYIRTYVERDVRDVLRVMDLSAFQRFVRLVAARTGTELNLSELADDAGISQPTARSWLTALQVGFLVTLLPPHHTNFRKRLRKRPKLHFLDTGLACHLLGIRTPEMLRNHPLRYALFESFIVSEMIKGFEHAGLEAPLFHWRDASGLEIDIIVDQGDRLLPIEVKSGATITSNSLRGLKRWTGIPSNPNKEGVLVYGGMQSSRRGLLNIRPWFLT